MSTQPESPPAPVSAPRGNADKVSPVRLQRRLLLLLIVPLCLLGIVSGWIDYRSASTAANQQDQQLQQLVPLLADSIIAVGAHAEDPPVLLLAPPVEEFLKERKGLVTYKIYTPKRHLLHGDDRLPSVVPLTREPEFFNQEIGGISYRMVVQRVPSVAGDVVVEVADASDPHKHWLQQLVMKVLLPNLVMMGLVAVFVSWAVGQALRPLRDLTLAIERRSPRDLSSINERGIPLEIRPLVTSLNWLFGMVNRQSEAQRRFIADAAHQMRTPLTGLKMQTELALHETDPEQLRLSLAHIAESTERADGPSPMIRSSTWSSMAGYRISSTWGLRRWISSMNRTSRGSRLVRIAARSPALARIGPEVARKPTPSSRATICASVVLPNPGGPTKST